MFDDKKFGTLFPTRTGTATGTANERSMLDSISGSDGFRTIMRTEVDGSVTMCRTRNGMPVFSNTGATTQVAPWRGLAAYPEGFEPASTWSSSVVFSATESYKIVAKNPIQLVPLVYMYWVGPKGNVCGNNGTVAYFTQAGQVAKYSKVTVQALPTSFTIGLGDVPVAKHGAIPFVSEASKTFSFATSNAVTNTLGVAAFGLNPLTVNFDPKNGPAYAEQLPQVISETGNEVVLHAKDEKYFQEPFPGGYTTDEKCYWYMRLKMGGSAWRVETGETLVRVKAATYWNSVAGDEVGGAYLPVTDDIEKMSWMQIWPTAQSPQIQGFNRYPDGVYLFGIDLMCVMDDEARSDQTLIGQRRDYRDWPITAIADSTATVGYVNGAAGLVPVQVRVKADYARHLFGEGQTYNANRDPWPCWTEHGFNTGSYPTARAEIGASTSDYKRKKVETSDSNNSFISVAVGSLEVKTFEVVASCKGDAILKHRANTNRMDTHNWEPWRTDLHISSLVRFTGFQPAPGYDWNSPQVQHDPYPSSARGSYAYADWTFATPYAAFIPETQYAAESARLNSLPTVIDTYDFAINPPTTQHVETDYITDLRQKATSRFIVGCDPQIGLVAYVEMVVDYDATIIGPAAGQWIYWKNEEFKHSVTCNFVIEYDGAKHTRQLFEVVVKKPLTLFETEHTNWYLWPIPGSQYDPGMMLCANPVILPTPSTFKGIDGVFQHQGVCSDFAGFTTKEVADPVGAGYSSGDNIKRLIYAKRFKVSDDNMHWLLSHLKIDECKRGTSYDSPVADLAAYYYCPELKAKLDVTYQVEFDQTGFVNWIDNIPTPTAVPPNRDASCWRI